MSMNSCRWLGRKIFKRLLLGAFYATICYTLYEAWILHSEGEYVNKFILKRADRRHAQSIAHDNQRRDAQALHALQQHTAEPDAAAPLITATVRQHVVNNGILSVDDSLPAASHPIYQMIRTARKLWKEKNKRQSTTLRDADTEYRRRNKGRAPPKGFDKWWAYIRYVA